jgi:hypothetical protein
MLITVFLLLSREKSSLSLRFFQKGYYLDSSSLYWKEKSSSSRFFLIFSVESSKDAFWAEFGGLSLVCDFYFLILSFLGLTI